MLYVQESFINQTEGHRFGDSDVYEAHTEEVGRLFKDYQSQYGRCVGKVFVDGPGGPIPVGWVFVQSMQYEDSNDRYVRETWVTVHEAPDTVTRKVNYHDLRKPVPDRQRTILSDLEEDR